jgi:hypothetical protein
MSNPQPGMDGFDPGPTHNRTNEKYNEECRQVLQDSDPGSLKDQS